MDLSGNVWEWQTNFYDSDRDWLALRGGFWNLDYWGARLASQYYLLPLGSNIISGFRVVVCPSPR